MKALSLVQPWASLLAGGAKRIETRSWGTAYRGLVAIHASGGLKPESRGAWRMPIIRETAARLPEPVGLSWNTVLEELIGEPRLEELPLGAVLAVGRLVECERITAENVPEEPERSFGNYAPGRWRWTFAGVVPLAVPVTARGMLGLWDWTAPTDVLLDSSERGRVY